MDFSFEHSFAAPPEAVAAVLLDLDFQRSLSDVGALEAREVLSQVEQEDGTVVRRTRSVLGIDLGAARPFVGDAEPAWEEEAIWDPDDLRWDWVIHPEVGADLLAASGTIRIVGDGGAARRVITGRVKVKVPLYGGRVEGWIVDGLGRAYEEEADRLSAWLARVTGP
ncbi:MAG: DUF2505 domain-containing protein [Actinomycetota bacterium]